MTASPVTAPARGPAVAALVFNAFTWGLSWWLLRRLHAQGLHPLWLMAMCFGLAAAGLLAWRPAAAREVARQPGLWVVMLAAGATNACFNWGVAIGDVVRVVLLFYLMPLWAVLLARLLLRERLTPRAALRVALALGGAATVLWPPAGQPLGAPSLPDLLGLAGGATFALNNVMLRRESGRSSASARALAMFAGGVVVTSALALLFGPAGGVPWPPAPAAGWLGGTLALALWLMLANLALQFGASRLPANTTAVIMITEVGFATVSSLALGAGRLDGRAMLGGALIVAAALLAAWQRD